MENIIQEFILYLHDVKRTSVNTEASYRRDLNKLLNYIEEQGVNDVSRITVTNLQSYLLYMEREGFAPATISRNIASIKALFHYLFKKGYIPEDVSEPLKAPKIEKKMPELLTTDEFNKLLDQPSGDSPKEVRDRAMLEL